MAWRGVKEGLKRAQVHVHVPPPRKFLPVPYDYHEQVKVRVASLSAEGVGMAVDENYPERRVMVPKVWPGEVVTARVYRNDKEFSNADLLWIDEASEDRIAPKCKYYDICSGCQFQHVSVSVQRDWKKSQVLHLLQEAGFDLSQTEFCDVIGEKHVFSYRSKITPQISLHKMKEALNTSVQSDDMISPTIGFFGVGTRHVVDIPECILATPALNEHYAIYRKESMISLNVDMRNGALSSKKRMLSSRLFRDDCNGSVISDPNASIFQEVCGIVFKYKAGEFFQVNPFILPTLVSYVIQEAKGKGCDYLIDAYCGCGLFSLNAAAHFVSVVGIEVSHMAVQSAKHNARANNILNAAFIEGKVEALFADVNKMKGIISDKSSVIIDPSRKGCDISFLEQLIEFFPQKIVYVSCNPRTQVRDALMLVSNGYVVQRNTPFDMFPQTKHIENVMTFVRRE